MKFPRRQAKADDRNVKRRSRELAFLAPVARNDRWISLLYFRHLSGMNKLRKEKYGETGAPFRLIAH
jgi:hypothetical protein